MDIWLTVLVVLEGFCLTSAIDCYNCTGVRNASDCHSVIYCPNQQHCIVQSHGFGENQTFTLGCADEVTCGITTTTATTVNTSTITHNATTSPSASVLATGTFTTTSEPPYGNTTDDNNTTASATSGTPSISGTPSNSSDASLVGRRELHYHEDDFMYDEPGGCKVCCETDSCNKHLCEPKPISTTIYPDSGCHDKPGFGCDDAIQYFNICSNINKAKVLCKKSCNLCDLVDGRWSEWGNWSSCDVTYGNGTRQRMRECDSPPPAHGGENCTGSDTDTELCTERNCPIDGDWGDWNSWSDCSVTCGIGLQKRIRNCSNPYPDADGLFCLGSPVDDKLCTRKHCYGDTWLEWSSWSKCSQSCDFGLISRTRVCNGTALFGQPCAGDARETKLCKDRECPAKIGEWLDWSPWSQCSHTCDAGIKSRSRDCNDTTNSCFGDIHESVLCKDKECRNPVSAFLVNGVARNGPENGTIVLSHVITNIGNDYNSSTGQFTCRIPGVYSFFFSIEKQPDVNQAFCQLMRNENATIYVGSRSAFVNDRTFQQASNSAVLELDTDDVIYLGRCSAPETFTTKSTFSGSLLVAEYDNVQ